MSKPTDSHKHKYSKIAVLHTTTHIHTRNYKCSEKRKRQNTQQV